MTKGPQQPLGQGTHRVAQMLAQMGALAAGRFANRISELDVTPAHAAVLRVVATEPGRSQQSLSVILSMPPARLTGLLDDLETRGLIERRRHDKDHRLFALYLTAAGQQFMGRLAAAGAEHERDITGVLGDDERRQLGVILEKLADLARHDERPRVRSAQHGQPAEHGAARRASSRAAAPQRRPPAEPARHLSDLIERRRRAPRTAGRPTRSRGATARRGGTTARVPRSPRSRRRSLIAATSYVG